MIYEYKNFSRGNLSKLTPENGDIYRGCNFTQELPNTEICGGFAGLQFMGCNLVNCDIPAGAIKEDCLHVQKSMCSHLNPKWTKLPHCPANCSHVVDWDEVTIDGQSLGKEYHYEDKVI